MVLCPIDNYIDGREFTKLTEAEVKQMVPAIGIAKKILRLIPKVIMEGIMHTQCFLLGR